jgi:hypothetical protein
MAITKDASVQEVVTKVVNINLADVTSGVDVAAMDLPANAVIISGHTFTTEDWNSTSTDVLDVGDAGSQNRYLNDGNVRAASALVALVPTGVAHAGGALTVRWVSGGGSPTTGKLRLVVTYIVLGKADYIYEL